MIHLSYNCWNHNHKNHLFIHLFIPSITWYIRNQLFLKILENYSSPSGRMSAPLYYFRTPKEKGLGGYVLAKKTGLAYEASFNF